MRQMMIMFAASACAGAVWDFMIGDPEGWWHPVRAMGFLIAHLEKMLRGCFPKTKRGEFLAGLCLMIGVCLISVLAGWGILWIAGVLHPALCFVCSFLMCGQLLAARSLKTESMRVHKALQHGDTEGARYAVSRIVGRDTEPLDEAGIVRAAVETVAENASDGVIAPFLWMLAFGPLGGVFYKAVNTMDSMVGYQNERYRWFGCAAAHLDDAVNYLPARLTGLLFVVAAWFLPGMSAARAWRIWRRDRRCHKSPNSAQGEAACAGALGVQLAGDAWYFGTLHKKPTIGEDERTIEPEDIVRANRLMMTAFGILLMVTFGWIGFLTGKERWL